MFWLKCVANERFTTNLEWLYNILYYYNVRESALISLCFSNVFQIATLA